MFRVACLAIAFWGTATLAFCPTLVPSHRPSSSLAAGRINYVCPDTYSMETQRQAITDQFKALHSDGHADPSPQEPAPVAKEPVVKTQPAVVKAAAPASQPAPAVVVASPPLPTATVKGSPFQQRNDYIVRAAAVGKSRWGAFEVERAASQHSLSQALLTLTPPVIDLPGSLFEQRNQQVLASAAAGKSRWGTLEVEKAKYHNGLQQALEALSA